MSDREYTTIDEASEDDSDRVRSTFDRADNTARLALELAEAMREIARLREDADIVEADLREVESDARTQRERADVAEAKVKAVEALRARYGERAENGCPVSLNYARAHRDLTTALGIEP